MAQAQSKASDPFSAYQQPLAGEPAKGKDDVFAGYQTPLVPDADFTTNPNKETTYQMTGADRKFVGVPYSKVGDATQAGWMISAEDLPKFFDVAHRDHKLRGNMTVPRMDGPPTSFVKPGAEKYAGAPPTPYGEMKPFESVGKALDEWFQSSTARREMNPDTKPVDSTVHANVDAAWNAAGNALKVPLNVANRAARMVWGLGSVPGQIYDTATGLFSADQATADRAWDSFVAMNPGEQLVQRTKQFLEERKQNPQMATENAIGDLVGLWAAGRATERFGSKTEKQATPKELRKGALERLRGGTRETLGVPENTEKAVTQFGKEAQAARDKNVTEAEKNRQSKVKTMRENRAAKQKHETATGETREHNEAVLRDRAKRIKAEQDLDTASRRLEQRIEQAQKKAKAADDNAWAAWRKKVGTAETDPATVVDTIGKMRNVMDPEDVAEFRRVLQESKPDAGEAGEVQETRDSIAKNQGAGTYAKASPAVKALIDDIVKRVGLDPDEAAAVKAISAPRLHVWKTQLEYAVRKATRGNVRYAIGQVLDAVRGLEGKLSEEAGAGEELARARALHGPYMDTFRNSPNLPRTVASNVRDKVTPQFTKESGMDRQLAMLGSYDNSIPNLAQHIGNLQDGLKALPKDAPLREQLKPNPPPLGAPGKPKLKELTPPPEAPNIRAANAHFIRGQLRKYGHVGGWVLRLVVGGGIASLSHGNFSALGGELLIGQAAVTLLTKALQSERALNWLARPSAEDLKMINSLPEGDAARLRAALNALADQERRTDPKARGIQVAPEMQKFLSGATKVAGVTGASRQQIKSDAEQRRPAGQPVSVSAPDGSVHVFQNQAAADQFKAAAGIP